MLKIFFPISIIIFTVFIVGCQSEPPKQFKEFNLKKVQTTVKSAKDDADAWNVAKKVQTIEAYEAYVEKFPKGKFIKEGQMIIRMKDSLALLVLEQKRDVIEDLIIAKISDFEFRRYKNLFRSGAIKSITRKDGKEKSDEIYQTIEMIAEKLKNSLEFRAKRLRSFSNSSKTVDFIEELERFMDMEKYDKAFFNNSSIVEKLNNSLEGTFPQNKNDMQMIIDEVNIEIPALKEVYDKLDKLKKKMRQYAN